MSLSMIKLIVFDLDGTLLDSVPDLAIATNQTLQALGKPTVSEAQVRDFVGNGADTLIARALSQSIEVNPDISYPLRLKARQIFDELYAATGHQRSVLYPTVKTTLVDLYQRGFHLALVTNKPSRFVPEILAQQRLKTYFCDVIGGDTFSHKKPNPMALKWLLTQYQLQPQQMLMVGDSKHDIQVAKNAGCRSFGVTYGYNHGEPIEASQPDFIGHQISDLLTLI